MMMINRRLVPLFCSTPWLHHGYCTLDYDFVDFHTLLVEITFLFCTLIYHQTLLIYACSGVPRILIACSKSPQHPSTFSLLVGWRRLARTTARTTAPTINRYTAHTIYLLVVVLLWMYVVRTTTNTTTLNCYHYTAQRGTGYPSNARWSWLTV